MRGHQQPSFLQKDWVGEIQPQLSSGSFSAQPGASQVDWVKGEVLIARVWLRAGEVRSLGEPDACRVICNFSRIRDQLLSTFCMHSTAIPKHRLTGMHSVGDIGVLGDQNSSTHNCQWLADTAHSDLARKACV